MRTRDEIEADLANELDFKSGVDLDDSRARLVDDVEDLLAALGVAEAALARVRALHPQGERASSEHFYCDPDQCDRAGEGELEPVCGTCRELWPCPTVAALVPTPEPPEAK